jgi:hypothetical protein
VVDQQLSGGGAVAARGGVGGAPGHRGGAAGERPLQRMEPVR